jgi:cytosine/adenosine deaminase-related metal-dependent hydrolase
LLSVCYSSFGKQPQTVDISLSQHMLMRGVFNMHSHKMSGYDVSHAARKYLWPKNCHDPEFSNLTTEVLIVMYSHHVFWRKALHI